MQAAADECRSLLRSGGWKRTVKAFFFAPRTGTPRQDILRLPPKYRVVMYLRYYEDFTTGEIARLLKIPQRHRSRPALPRDGDCWGGS